MQKRKYSKITTYNKRNITIKSNIELNSLDVCFTPDNLDLLPINVITKNKNKVGNRISHQSRPFIDRSRLKTPVGGIHTNTFLGHNSRRGKDLPVCNLLIFIFARTKSNYI